MSRILLSKPAILCAANSCGESQMGGGRNDNATAESSLRGFEKAEAIYKSKSATPTNFVDCHESAQNLGADSSDILSAFQKATPFLQENTTFLGHKIFVGVCENLLPLPKTTQPHFITRTNTILYNAISTLEPLITNLKNALGGKSIGISLGTTTTGIGENYLAIKKYYEANATPRDIDYTKIEYVGERSALCNPADFLKAHYGLDSLSFGLSSACTSGGKAIIMGARLLQANLCKAVICGGVDSLNHLTLAGFNALEILSQSRSKPFSAERDGINIGEGAGIFVMINEDLLDSHPQFENDFQIALLGHKSNNDAFHITQPSPSDKMQLEILRGFGSVDYINLHGTGTIANDSMEAKIVAKVFPQTPCSTIKPFIGHTLGAAGAIELGVCAELILHSLKNGESPLPPHIYTSAFNDIALVKKGEKKRVKTALSTSFAFGGDNSAILIGAK